MIKYMMLMKAILFMRIRGHSTKDFPRKYEWILYSPEFSSLKKTSLSATTSWDKVLIIVIAKGILITVEQNVLVVGHKYVKGQEEDYPSVIDLEGLVSS